MFEHDFALFDIDMHQNKFISLLDTFTYFLHWYDGLIWHLVMHKNHTTFKRSHTPWNSKDNQILHNNMNLVQYNEILKLKALKKQKQK